MKTVRVSAPPFEVIADPPVLQAWEDGSVRIDGTRLKLERVIVAHRDGYSAEEIGEDFGPTPVHVIYSVLAYYYRHQAEVDAYLDYWLAREVDAVREIHRRWPADGLKTRLEQRLKEMRADAASSGG